MEQGRRIRKAVARRFPTKLTVVLASLTLTTGFLAIVAAPIVFGHFNPSSSGDVITLPSKLPSPKSKSLLRRAAAVRKPARSANTSATSDAPSLIYHTEAARNAPGWVNPRRALSPAEREELTWHYGLAEKSVGFVGHEEWLAKFPKMTRLSLNSLAVVYGQGISFRMHGDLSQKRPGVPMWTPVRDPPPPIDKVSRVIRPCSSTCIAPNDFVQRAR